MIEYTLDNFEEIIYGGIDYTLSEEVKQNIIKISEKVGAPEYIRTPQFEKKDKKRDKLNKKDINIECEWETIRNFEITKKNKSEGIDIIIDKVRKIINKVTEKTYNNLLPLVIKELDELWGPDAAEEICDAQDVKKLNDSIFLMLSETIFYSKLYALLYKQLLDKYDDINVELDNYIFDYKNKIKEIKYCNPQTDYDEFCRLNKINEKINATGVFLVNLEEFEKIKLEDIVSIIKLIQDSIINLLNQENKTEIIQELSEILGNMVITGKERLRLSDEWSTIFHNIDKISQLKVKDFNSLSNKTIFRHMDIMDAFM